MKRTTTFIIISIVFFSFSSSANKLFDKTSENFNFIGTNTKEYSRMLNALIENCPKFNIYADTFSEYNVLDFEPVIQGNALDDLYKNYKLNTSLVFYYSSDVFNLKYVVLGGMVDMYLAIFNGNDSAKFCDLIIPTKEDLYFLYKLPLKRDKNGMAKPDLILNL